MTRGAIIYDGPSAGDGAPIVAIITGLTGVASANEKTGPMAQVWILRADVHPVDAVHIGADVSICGGCPLRPANANGGPMCYVQKRTGPAAVYRAYQRGAYPHASASDIGAYLHADGRAVRIGAYGDAAFVPLGIWRGLLGAGAHHTAYTHQWRTAPQLRGICMASADSEADADAARAAGWRVFRVRGEADPLMAGEIACPASAEGGKRTQCVRCGLCNGARADDRRAHIAIIDHGPTAPRTRRIRKGGSDE